MIKETFISYIVKSKRFKGHSLELFASVDNRGVSVNTIENKDKDTFIDLRKALRKDMGNQTTEYLYCTSIQEFLSTVRYSAEYTYNLSYNSYYDRIKVESFLKRNDIY